jgi:hypothetical protein
MFIVTHSLVVLVKVLFLFHDKVVFLCDFFKRVEIDKELWNMNCSVLRNVPVSHTFFQVEIVLKAIRVFFFWEGVLFEHY